MIVNSKQKTEIYRAYKGWFYSGLLASKALKISPLMMEVAIRAQRYTGSSSCVFWRYLRGQDDVWNCSKSGSGMKVNSGGGPMQGGKWLFYANT